MSNKCLITILLIFTLFDLSGCLSVATTGASLTYDNYNVRKKALDRYISWQIQNTIDGDTELHIKGNITANVFNQVVLLTGQAPSAVAKQRLVNYIEKLPDVLKIYDELTIGPPKLGTTAATDTWLTGRVKARIIIDKDIDPNTIKVVTENSVVYLMGVTTKRQAQAATYIAQHTPGVTKVVIIFYYLIIPEIKKNEKTSQ